jgi:hypothetical protein
MIEGKSPMDQSGTTDRISAGDRVIASDGTEVGTVAALHRTYLLVEKGVLFLTDYHVPYQAVDRYDGDDGTVRLNVTGDEALNSGWDQHPDDPEDEPVDTLLTGAATVPDPPDIAVIEPDDDPLRSSERGD